MLVMTLFDTQKNRGLLLPRQQPAYGAESVWQLLRYGGFALPDGFLVEVYADLSRPVDNVVVHLCGPAGFSGAVYASEREYDEDPLALARRIGAELDAMIADIKRKVALEWTPAQE